MPRGSEQRAGLRAAEGPGGASKDAVCELIAEAPVPGTKQALHYWVLNE